MGHHSSVDWVPGLPLDSSLSLELATRLDGESGVADPFVKIGSGARYSDVFLTRLATPDGVTLREFAVKMMRDGWRPPTSGLASPLVDNVEIDAMWERERQNLQASQGPGVVAFFGFASELPAVTFCQRTRKFFSPPCPQTGTELQVCTDDNLLRDSGLPTYAGSTTRFLYSPQQRAAGGGDPLTFYTWSSTGGDPPVGVDVRRRTELYRDLGRLIHQNGQREVAQPFPCRTCEHRLECYPEGAGAIPAETALIPLSFYPSPVLVTEVMDASFGEWCDHLGGANAPVEDVAASGREYFHAPGSGADSLLEILYLKLQSCREACRGVRSFQERTQRPHLGVAPDNVMVRRLPAGAGLPRRWQFTTRLTDLGAQHRFQLPGDPDTELLIPTPDAPTSCQSPFVDAAEFSQELSMQLTIQAAVDHGDGQRLTIDAKAQGSRVSGPRPGDVVTIVPLTGVPGLGEVTMTGTVDKAQPAGAQFTVELAPTQRLDAEVLPFESGGSVTFFRRLQAPCDLFGVGMTMCRGLLVNDGQDLFAVEDALRDVLDRLELAVAGVEEPDRSYVVTTLGNLLEDARFEPAQLLYRAADRQAAAAAILDPSSRAVWFDALVIVFRLLTNLPQFSYCAHHGDYDPARPSAVTARVEADLESLLRRIHVELFGRATRGREVANLCDGLLQEVNATLYGSEALE